MGELEGVEFVVIDEGGFLVEGKEYANGCGEDEQQPEEKAKGTGFHR